jgi:hypothetical protein
MLAVEISRWPSYPYPHHQADRVDLLDGPTADGEDQGVRLSNGHAHDGLQVGERVSEEREAA